MSMPVLQTDIYTDFQGLAGLRARARNDEQATLREAAGQFEALFIQMMLKSMRDASLGEGLLDSDAGKTYQGMFDRQIAIELSRHQGLGLAEMMVQQLGRTQQGAAADTVPAPPVSPSWPSVPLNFTPREKTTESAGAVQEKAVDWQPAGREAFVRDLWPHARKAARRLGTRPEVLIAQAALETGWGRSMIRGADGRNSFNLFGIKADGRWQGERVLTDTVEYRDGLMRRERAAFRAYPSLADSFADYADFLQSSPRYREALAQVADTHGYARALQQAGYATDPDYAGKIGRILDSAPMRAALSAIKAAPAGPLT